MSASKSGRDVTLLHRHKTGSVVFSFELARSMSEHVALRSREMTQTSCIPIVTKVGLRLNLGDDEDARYEKQTMSSVIDTEQRRS